MKRNKNKEKRKKPSKLVRLSGRPLDIIETHREMSGGRRTYNEIIGKLAENGESPLDQLVNAFNEVENISKNNFNPNMGKVFEYIRPILFLSVRGKMDIKFCEKKLLEIIDGNKSKACDVK